MFDWPMISFNAVASMSTGSKFDDRLLPFDSFDSRAAVTRSFASGSMTPRILRRISNAAFLLKANKRILSGTLQLAGQIVGGLPSVVGILGEASLDDPIQRRR